MRQGQTRMLLVCCTDFNHTRISLTNTLAKWNGDSPRLGVGSKTEAVEPTGDFCLA